MFLPEMLEITPARLLTGMEKQAFHARYKSREDKELTPILSFLRASRVELSLFII